jgi:hypothetical protein
MDPRSIITGAHQSVAVTDMPSDTSFDTPVQIAHLNEVRHDIKGWEGELVSIANLNNPERRRELGGWLREARQILEAIKDDLASRDNRFKDRSPELAESSDSDMCSQSRESYQRARGPFSMKSLGLALRQEPIKGRSRKLEGEPFKVAKGAFSARSGPRSRRHKGDNGSSRSHSINTSFFMNRVGSYTGSARTGNSARIDVGPSVSMPAWSQVINLKSRSNGISLPLYVCPRTCVNDALGAWQSMARARIVRLLFLCIEFLAIHKVSSSLCRQDKQEEANDPSVIT